MTLVLVAHGTREPSGAVVAREIADAVAARLPGVPVELAFADVRPPNLTSVLRGLTGPAVVVPAFLAAGYHVRVDLPEQAALAGIDGVRFARPLGPAPAVVAALVDRLRVSGWRRSDALVLAAAGSSDPHAVADVRTAARLLSARVGRPVRIGYIATGRPGIDEAVRAARTHGRGGRVAVASWLLAPGLFHRWLGRSGADVVSEPIGAHDRLVAEVVRRYREAAVVGRVAHAE